MRRIFGAAILLLLFSPCVHAKARKRPGEHWVKTYHRKDGTIVNGHFAGSGSVLNQGRADAEAKAAFFENSRLMQKKQVKTVRPVAAPTYTYGTTPNLEPSWVRQQRLEKSLGVAGTDPSKKTAAQETISGVCVEILDGATLRLQSGEIVRLYAIALPKAGSHFADESKANLAKLALHQQITVYRKTTDKSGRTGGWAFVGDKCLNSAQISAGMAKVDAVDLSERTKLGALEARAKSAHLGIWRG